MQERADDQNREARQLEQRKVKLRQTFTILWASLDRRQDRKSIS
jgi:hypothetical protein